MSEALPRSGRLALPTWLSPRIALGGFLVLGSVLAGARVFASADRYTPVLVARHALVPGEHLVGSDLRVGRLRLAGGAAAYLAASSDPDGYVVTRYVGAGEVVPVGALSSSASVVASTRSLTVTVGLGHLPLDLSRGDQVDVYVTPKPAAGATPGPPTLVLSAASVDQVSGGDDVGADAEIPVVLDVGQDQVAPVLRAVNGGVVDLVRVPAVDGTAS